MHAVRRELLEMQAAATSIELRVVDLPWPCPNEVYVQRMRAAIEQLIAEGFDTIAFGDLFLQDIREYREKQLEALPLRPIFPLWNIPTDQLAGEMQAAGLRAHLTCIDPQKLGAGFAGRKWNSELLSELPVGVDPCGENGEFHTFVYDGPMFSHPIDVRVGEIVERDGFVFADLIHMESEVEIG
jgi:diphthamide synthase (EF-2-diphthine--ammonia ligase)